MKNEHHAIFFEGNFKKDLDEVIKFFADDLEFGTQGNPDILVFTNEKLSIEKAREIRQYAQALPLKEKFLHIIVGFDSATLEAQNALLKALEEPGVSAKFYLLAPSFNSVIATLQSRLIKEEKISKSDAHVFLKILKDEALKNYKENSKLLSNIEVAEKYLESSSSIKQILSLVALS